MKLKLTYILIALLGITISLKAQFNLVPNPGFEEYTDCPDNSGQISKATHWFTCLPSPDYFNTCATIYNISIPDNNIGQQTPYEGNGYSGIYNYVKKEFNAPPLMTRFYFGMDLLK